MAGSSSSKDRAINDAPPLMLGGHAALAESEWMGVAQASDVLEPLHIAAPRRQRVVVPRLPRLQLAGRAAIIALLLGSIGVLAIPITFAVTASVETVILGAVLLLKLQRQMRTGAAIAH